MAHQSNSSVTRGTLVPDINGLNALASKIGKELKNGAISTCLFVNDHKVALAALGIAVPLLVELLKGTGVHIDGTPLAKGGNSRACWSMFSECNNCIA